MTTAGAVAQELRKLADALDKEPELEIFPPEIDFKTKYGGERKKEFFLALARAYALNQARRSEEAAK